MTKISRSEKRQWFSRGFAALSRSSFDCPWEDGQIVMGHSGERIAVFVPNFGETETLTGQDAVDVIRGIGRALLSLSDEQFADNFSYQWN